MVFQNRRDAGRQLAAKLASYANRPDVLVLGLPRGGVPVASEVAAKLRAPLDVLLVRKLGVPGHAELAMGAIAAGGIEVLNQHLIGHLDIPPALVREVALREGLELQRRQRAFRGDRLPPEVRDRTVIVVDDGLATGATMEAAIVALRAQKPAAIVVAVPVGAPDACERLRCMCEEVICLATPARFNAVGEWYEDFSETTDAEVRRLVAGPSTAVRVPIGRHHLDGNLVVPPDAKGIVVFVHGSGSSRHSPRNQRVARVLQDCSFATLLIDLLTQQEEELDEISGEYRFDIRMLAERVVLIVQWLKRTTQTADLPVGLFGASTGGGAALVAAAQLRNVAAVVSRGGRPDLAGEALPAVTAPTLLIVGALDTPVIAMNQSAMAKMRAPVSLEIVPGATHLFEEPGALDRVASLAARWFERHLTAKAATRGDPAHSVSS